MTAIERMLAKTEEGKKYVFIHWSARPEERAWVVEGNKELVDRYIDMYGNGRCRLFESTELYRNEGDGRHGDVTIPID